MTATRSMGSTRLCSQRISSGISTHLSAGGNPVPHSRCPEGLGWERVVPTGNSPGIAQAQGRRIPTMQSKAVWPAPYRRALTLLGMALVVVLSGCASSPNYRPAPSAERTPESYHREQLHYPTGKELGGAAVSGAIGGLLGPLGALITVIGTHSTRMNAMETYWRSIDNTEIVGVVIEDVTEIRNAEFLDHGRWFANLPPKEALPQQVNIDTGSGNHLVLPVKPGLNARTGDVVTVLAGPTAHKLIKPRADFFLDLPWVVGIRCRGEDSVCMADPDNEPGVAKRFTEAATAAAPSGQGATAQ